MQHIIDLALSEQGVTLLLWIAGIAFSALKGTEKWQSYTKGRYDKAVDAIFAGVKDTYHGQVEQIKATGQSLTIEQKRSAREAAIRAATEYAAAKGIDLAKTVGQENLNVWVERAVLSLKGKAPAPVQ